MAGQLSTVLHFMVIVAVAILGLSLVCSALAKPFLRWCNRFEPVSRLLLLRGYTAIPLLGGFVLGIMISVPGMNHGSNLPLEHCHQLSCHSHGVAHAPTGNEVIIALVAITLLLWASAKALAQWLRCRRLVQRINTASHAALAPQISLIESVQPMAFSLGLRKSFAVISTGLVEALTPKQLEIICIHEQAHAEHHDNWYKWVLRWLAIFHWPGTRLHLLSEHALAMEQQADQGVAKRIVDPVAVAETIVAVQRLMQPLRTTAPINQFLGSVLERRVQHLLAEQQGQRLPRYFMLAVLGALAGLAVLGATPLHNSLEIILAL